jgi:hypothetical protein
MMVKRATSYPVCSAKLLPRRRTAVSLNDIPLMTRGRGVIRQRYWEGGLADCKVFRLADGLSWRLGENRTGERDPLIRAKISLIARFNSL